MGADAGADARERMRESGFKSCDVSEPIRCAKIVSAPTSALTSALVPCDLSEPMRELSCIRSRKSTNFLTFDSNSTSAFFESDVLKR